MSATGFFPEGVPEAFTRIVIATEDDAVYGVFFWKRLIAISKNVLEYFWEKE